MALGAEIIPGDDLLLQCDKRCRCPGARNDLFIFYLHCRRSADAPLKNDCYLLRPVLYPHHHLPWPPGPALLVIGRRIFRNDTRKIEIEPIFRGLWASTICLMFAVSFRKIWSFLLVMICTSFPIYTRHIFNYKKKELQNFGRKDPYPMMRISYPETHLRHQKSAVIPVCS